MVVFEKIWQVFSRQMSLLKNRQASFHLSQKICTCRQQLGQQKNIKDLRKKLAPSPLSARVLEHRVVYPLEALQSTSLHCLWAKQLLCIFSWSVAIKVFLQSQMLFKTSFLPENEPFFTFFCPNFCFFSLRPAAAPDFDRFQKLLPAHKEEKFVKKNCSPVYTVKPLVKEMSSWTICLYVCLTGFFGS